MELIKQKFNPVEQSILRYLFLNPEKKFNQIDLARELNVSSTAISKSLKKIEMFVDNEKDKGRLSIRLKRENSLVTGVKRAENLRQLYVSGFCDFIFENFPGCTVVVFGSYSFGEDLSDSDIDIAVFGCPEKNMDVENFEKVLQRKIIFQFYDSLEKTHKNLKENILNGIVLKGGFQL